MKITKKKLAAIIIAITTLLTALDVTYFEESQIKNIVNRIGVVLQDEPEQPAGPIVEEAH